MEPILLKLVELTAAAVIQYLVDKTDLVDHVRGWLKRDPASLAYQRALLRAYAAFARSDPALAKSFFDETFLAGAAVPELAKQLTRHQHANSAELARLWAASLFSDALAEKRAAYATDARVVHACANFLQWLENELKREQVFQPLFDSRALDALEAKFDDLVRVLTTQRDEAMQRAQAYQLVVEHTTQSGGVNIAGGAHVHAQDIFSGDKYVIENYHAYFSGGFTTLDDYYIAPDSVFERVKVNEFVGREWLTGKLDRFLDDASRPSGVFRLEGEAGVGKTSFLAHLVRERGYLHLFAEQVPGDNNVERALLSLGAQIVSRYRLDPYADRNTLPAIAGGTDFLYKLLNLASQRLTDGEKIVVVCDALDEAGNGTNGNVFGLPTTLPENVFFVLSQRPVSVRLEIKCNIHQERLKPDAAENLQDMHDYLRGMARRPAVAQQLKARNYSEAEFVSVLSEKSGGVWMYLQYVLDEIQRGWRHPLELENLPNGLVGYYLAYWGDWRAGRNQRGKGESEWYALYLPLLTTLAAAQEPIPLDTLIAWAGVNESQYRVRNLLREQWRAFITEREEKDSPLRYILYHASLRDFLTGKVKTDALATADGNFIDELREGTRAAHQRIVKNFAERCRGEWTDLIPDEYARRYLTLHLQGAEQYDILRELVAWSDAWAKARYDNEESWSGYLTDLERVWAFAEQRENIGWQIRCALIESTIHSLAGNIFPELLVQLVETNLWSPARALAHIPQMPQDFAKAEALEKLAPWLPRELLGEALTAARGIQDESYRANALSGLAAHLSAEQLDEALTAARAIQDESYRANALSELAAHLSAEQLDEALAAARGMQDEHSRARALSGMAAHLSAEQLHEALTAARAIQNESARAFALSGLAAHLSAEEKMQVMRDALTAARAIRSDSARAFALSGLTAHLSGQEKEQVVRDALTAARAIQDEYVRAEALSGLAAHLSAEQLNEALTAARAIQNEDSRANALGRLAAHLSAEEKEQVVNEALTAARTIQFKPARADVLSGLAAHLSPEEKVQVMNEALTAVQTIQDKSDRARALSGLAAHLSAEEKAQVVNEALTAVQTIQDKSDRARALSGLAAHLSAEQLREALTAARAIEDESARARALSGLAAHLSAEQLDEALTLARAIQDEYYRADALRGLAAHLSAEQLREALTAAREIQDESDRANALSGLAAYLSAGQLHEALTAARAIQNESSRAEALSGLAAHLSAEQLREALTAAREIQKESARAFVLSDLAAHLSAEEKAQVVNEALRAARAIQDEYSRANALSGLAAHLSAEQLREALTAAREIQKESARAFVLSDLAAHLSAEEKVRVMNEALRAARAIRDVSTRAFELSGLAAHLSAEEKVQVVNEALTAARAIQSKSTRAEALSGLAAHLSAEEQPTILAQAFDIALQSTPSFSDERPDLFRSVMEVWEKIKFKGFERKLWIQGLHSLARHPRKELLDDLTALLPLIHHLGGQGAVNEMFFAVRDVGRWWR